MSLLNTKKYNLSPKRFIERTRQIYMKRSVNADKNNRFDQLDGEAVERALLELGCAVEPFNIDWKAFEAYREARLGQFGRWENERFIEKQLEYFVTDQLQSYSSEDIVMDVGSWFSPYPDFIRNQYSCQVYAQDLVYPQGVDGWRIGGDAADLPLPDESISKIVLHCTFEHFEGDADSRFIPEVARVLKPGGRMIIAPLYLHQNYTIWTDPSLFASAHIPVDEGANVYKNVGWNNEFGRHYSPQAFFERVYSRTDKLDIKVLRVTNVEALDPRCYIRFVGVFEKKK